MPISLGELGVRGIVLDIEGTTTPVSFVYETLFPYARTQLRPFLRAHAADAVVREALDMLRAERGADDPDGDPATYIESLMDADTKSAGLKLLQGKIWERGYADGGLRGVVFPDVVPAFQRWRDASVELSIYSSGSVLTQCLLFGSTSSGDLTPFIRHYFDTGVGPKRAPASYGAIAKRIGCAAESLLFISDVTAELDAARAAGFQTLLCIRPGNAPQPDTTTETIRTFDEIVA